MFGLNSRHPESQTCTNAFNGSELRSNLPQRHKLSNYAWQKTEPGEGQAEELGEVPSAALLQLGRRPASLSTTGGKGSLGLNS